MKSTKRNLIVLFALTMLVVSSLACSESSESVEPEPTPTPKGLVVTMQGTHSTLTRVACFTDFAANGTDEVTEACSGLVAEWEDANIACKIKLVQGKACD